MQIDLEYAGGLGDIFYQIFHDGGYCALSRLEPHDRARVILISHNPHARELFDYHPCARQIDVVAPGYWLPEQDRQMRRLHALPARRPSAFPCADTPEFHAAPSDEEWLAQLHGNSYVLFSASAGLPDRNIPPHLIEQLVQLATSYSLLPVFVGRSYRRLDRVEMRFRQLGTLDQVDRLTVPGVAVALQGARGVVCGHSAINMLAWLRRKPLLLLYPQAVQDTHIARRDQWAFGVDFEECRHARFDSPEVGRLAEELFQSIGMKRRADMPTAIETSPDSRNGTSVGLGFEDFTTKLIADALPMAQNVSPGNIGFGWLYYGFVRNTRPDFVVAIGSCAGFAPFCAARGAQDNGHGKVIFIDPSYTGDGPPGWGGRGYWSDASAVNARVAAFALGGWFEHFKMTSEEAFPGVRSIVGDGNVGVLIIDGSHTYEDSLRDFELYSSLIHEGYVLLHDATTADCEVSKTIETLRCRGYPIITLNKEVGLSIVEVKRAASVKATWSYLCNESNRAQLLLPIAQQLLKPGDRIIDIYCGASPLTPLLGSATVFGFDSDGTIIGDLQQQLPAHQWRQIMEREIFFAELPPQIEVMLGLGLVHGYAPWDPKTVVETVRYLLGRYAPRACLFEAAADYHDADIIVDLAATLSRHGYRICEHMLVTDMPSFSRRNVLTGER